MPVQSASPIVRIQLLGTLHLCCGARAIPPFPTSKAAALFAYLAYFAPASHPRGALAGRFWPDLPEDAARRRLSQELWRLRRHLNKHVGHPLVVGSVQVGLDPDAQWEVDVHLFRCETEDMADREALARAVARYTGDLLLDLDDEWILPERESLRRRFVQALTVLAEQESRAGHWDKALEYALRLVQEEPLFERGHRLVMRCYMHLGRPHMALAQFDQLAQRLREELDASPTPATLQLVEDIRSAVQATTPSPEIPFLDNPEGLPLVGRERERAILVDAVEWALGNEGGVVLVEGEAGMGKSKLLDALAEDALWRGAQVGRAAAGEVDIRALDVWVRALTPLLTPLRIQKLALLLDPLWQSVLARYFPAFAETLGDLPPPPPLAPDAEQQRAREAFLHLLRAMGHHSPLVLLLDDLHRADLESLETLRLLARGLRRDPVLVVGAYRGEAAQEDTQRWPLFRRIDQAGLRARVVLAPLDPSATEGLIRRALGMVRPAHRFSARIHSLTGGNPFFVLESLRTLYESGLLYPVGTREWATPWDQTPAGYEELVLPERVEALLEERMQGLSVHARDLLAPAAVLGMAFSLPVLQTLSELTPLQSFQALQELIARGFLVETDTHLRFRHALMREVVYQNLPMRQARALHRRAGQILAEQGQEPPATLAHHFTLAQDWPQALHYHRKAGEEALAQADYRRARYHMEQALEALDHLPRSDRTLQVDLLLAYEHILDILGDAAHRAQVLDRLTSLTAHDPALQGEVLCRTAAYHIRHSHYSVARQAAEQALGLARRLQDVDLQVRALTVLGQIEDLRGAPAKAVSLLEQAVALEPRVRGIQIEALLALASALVGAKRYPEARGAASAALDRCAELGLRHRQVDALNVLGIIAMEEGLYERAAEYHRQGIAWSREIGYRYGEVRALINLANVFNKTGSLGECIRLYEEAISAASVSGLERVEVITRVNLASVLVAFVGDVARARELLADVPDYARRVEDPATLGHALAILTAADLTDERWEEARRHMDAAKSALETAQEWYILAQFQRARALWHVFQGDLRSAFREVEAGLALARQYGMAALAPWMLAMMGWIRALEGDAAQALALTQAAIEALEDVDEADYMMWYYRYVALDAAGHRAEATQALARSVEKLEAVLATLSPAHQAMSRERVPEHREILAAWAAHQPRYETVTLPARNGAGTCTVRWSVHLPEDLALPEGPVRRRHRLRRLLDEAAAQGARPTLQALARALGVSPRTVRRDLATMDDAESPVT